MIYLFSTKAALRKAMVGLSSNSQRYPVPAKTIEAIADYLTEGGLSQNEAKIKAQEEELSLLKQQSKSLAEEISLNKKALDDLQHRQDSLADQNDAIYESIATAQEQLDSLVAQIGAAERETPGPDATIEQFCEWVSK